MGFNKLNHIGHWSGLDAFGDLISVDGTPDLVWFNTTNVIVSTTGALDNDTLTTNSGNDVEWTQRNPWSQQISMNQIWDISFKLNENFQIFGMAKMARTADNYVDIDYCMYRNSATQLFIFEQNVVVLDDPAADCTKVFRITSDGMVVRYYLDSVLKYTSAVAPDTGSEYKIKGSFFRTTNNTGVNILSL